MKSKSIAAFVVFFTLSIAGYAQQPVTSETPDNSTDDVVKITSKLVQFDAVVTDKDGRQVPGLKAEDFEILQDGKPQPITFFSYVNTDSATPRSVPGQSSADATIARSVPSRTGSENSGRILTFIVDDGNCSASLIGLQASRMALEKFVNEQMLPGDRVAVYQTRSGSSVFQQYTSDKPQLLKAARKIRWYPPTGSCTASDGSFYDAARSNTFEIGSKTVTIESDAERKIRESSEDFNKNNQVVGTIGVLRYVVRGLEQVGGRKVVFLLSDGMPFRGRDGRSLSAVDVLRDLTDLANRSSVVFNTIDSRGLFTTSVVEARDSVSTRDEGNAAATDRLVNDRSRDVRNSQDGLAFLANETGGTFYQGQNFLDKPIGKALNLEKGYYLLAYEPDGDTFKGKNFNNIDIRLKRPELKVLSRTGFLGSVNEAVKPKKRTGDSELYEAILAPLPKAGLKLQLTAFFGNGKTEGNFVRSMIHLDGGGITFVDDASGNKKAVFDVVAVTLNEKNEVVDEFTRAHTFKVPGAAVPMIKQNGLVYTTDIPIKKAGTYNFLVALRDGTSKLLGTAGQVIQIPDFKKGVFMLSALTVAEVDTAGKFTIPVATSGENAISLPASTAVPAIRRFRRGTIIAYAYTIYNAKLEAGTNKPKISIQTNLYRNGDLVSEGTPLPADLVNQDDWSRINDFTYLRLNQTMAPGEYTLQLIVNDLSAKGKNQTSTQSVDFEVIN